MPFTVGRGPVPRRASIGETAFVCVRFSRRSNDRGGNPLGCACGIRGPPRYGLQSRLRFTVGRGPVPRRASVEETALGGGWFSRRSNARGGQASALPWLAFGFRVGRAIAGDRPPRYGPGRGRLAMRRSGSGDPELRSLGHANARGGQAPALRTNLANRDNPVNPAHLLLIVKIL